MRAAATSADASTSCPFCTHSSTHSLTHTAAAWLRPLLDKLPSCPRLRTLLPYRYNNRWLLVFIVVTVIMMVLFTYVSPGHLGPAGWLAALGAGSGSGGNVCSLICPHIPPGDSTRRPPAQPLEHACLITSTLPMPCQPNRTRSEILAMRPINFLPNYRNPCWYEPIPGGGAHNSGLEEENVVLDNVYANNLFNCFSHGANRVFREMAGQNFVRWETERRPQRLRCLPYFYIAGMPKSGSTDLFRKIMEHPDVVRPPMKEPHWWSKNRFGQRLYYSSSVPLHDYIDLFDKAALHIESRLQMENDDNLGDDDVSVEDDDVSTQGQGHHEASSAYHPVITVDASASTFWNNDDWWRLPENCGHTEPLFTNAHYIRRLTPQARIIVIFRNPTTRLYSDYLYFTKSNKSVENFHEDVILSMEKLRECTAQHSLRSCIYDKQVANGKAKVRLRVGVYHVYLSEWLKVFPREQVLVLRTEDYSKDVRRTIRHVYRFLGLRQLTQEEEKKLVDLPIANKRKQKDRDLGPMWDKTRQVLQDFYRPHNQLLAQILDDDRFLWDDVTIATRPDDGSQGEEGPANGSHNVTLSSAEQGTGQSKGASAGVTASAEKGKRTVVPHEKDDTEEGDDINDDAKDDVITDDEYGVREENDVTDDDEEDSAQDEDEVAEDEDEDEYEDSGYSYSDSGYAEDVEEDDEDVEDS